MPIPVVDPLLAGRHPLAGHELTDAEMGVLFGHRVVRAQDVVTGRPVVVRVEHVVLLPDRLKRDLTGLTREDFVLVGSR